MPELEFTGERVVPGQVEADLWNEHYARYLFAARWAAGKRVADLGCGTGYGAALLAETAASAVGVDVSAEAVEYARSHYTQRYLDARPHLSYLAASAAATGLASASYDLITCFELIEHLENWPELLAEAARLLAPGGLFLVSTPNKHYYAEARIEAGPNPYHAHEFEWDEFIAALGSFFPHVAMFVQNPSAATVIQPAIQPGAATTHAELRMEAEAAEVADPASGAFYLALCSLAPIAPSPAFVHMPRTANMLREREFHIKRLEAKLASLSARHVVVQSELEDANRWAEGLNQDLAQARQRVADVQRELAEHQAAAQQAVNDLQTRHNHDVAEANKALDATHQLVNERTEWALKLDAELAAMRASRWHRLGRKLGLGPGGR